MDLLGIDTQNKEIRYRIDDGAGNTYTRWANGVNPTAAGGTWSVQRYDAAGAYVDSPININWATGLVETNRLYTRAKAANQIPAELRSFDQFPTVSLFKVALGDGTSKFEVLWDGTLRSNWGSSGYRMTQLGSTQIVREGAVGAYTLLACYTSVANADAGAPVFEVRPNGVQIPAATGATDAVQKQQMEARCIGGVASGTTDANGQLVVTLPTSPTGKWAVTATPGPLDVSMLNGLPHVRVVTSSASSVTLGFANASDPAKGPQVSKAVTVQYTAVAY
jgi:hypothetical protein